jgi:hypothetical protein
MASHVHEIAENSSMISETRSVNMLSTEHNRSFDIEVYDDTWLLLCTERIMHEIDEPDHGCITDEFSRTDLIFLDTNITSSEVMPIIRAPPTWYGHQRQANRTYYASLHICKFRYKGWSSGLYLDTKQFIMKRPSLLRDSGRLALLPHRFHQFALGAFVHSHYMSII